MILSQPGMIKFADHLKTFNGRGGEAASTEALRSLKERLLKFINQITRKPHTVLTLLTQHLLHIRATRGDVMFALPHIKQ